MDRDYIYRAKSMIPPTKKKRPANGTLFESKLIEDLAGDHLDEAERLAGKPLVGRIRDWVRFSVGKSAGLPIRRGSDSDRLALL